jgi:formamidopyrimidine-DNA glycosylase
MLDLEEGLRLSFNDTRKFGRVWLVADPQEVLADLGPEPLGDDLNPQDFYDRLHTHRRQLKPLLMDQSFLAGLGNIYADEALHLAHLHPLTTASQLDFESAGRLWKAFARC